jgi:hypothetical protein
VERPVRRRGGPRRAEHRYLGALDQQPSEPGDVQPVKRRGGGSISKTDLASPTRQRADRSDPCLARTWFLSVARCRVRTRITSVEFS